MSCACGKDTCGCSAPQVIQLMDESGQLHDFYLADRFDLEFGSYVFAVNVENPDQCTMLKYTADESGNLSLRNIPNESEWEQLQAAIAAMSPAQ